MLVSKMKSVMDGQTLNCVYGSLSVRSDLWLY